MPSCSSRFNGKLNSIEWPELIELSLGDNSTNPIDGYWPKLKKVSLGDAFNQNIKYFLKKSMSKKVSWPSLEDISLGMLFNHQLNVTWSNLKKIKNKNVSLQKIR
jgi:hypothetical protein